MRPPRLNGRTPLFIAINSDCPDAERAQRDMADVLRAARRQHHFFPIKRCKNPEVEYRRAAHIASRHEGAVIVVGDDGAINAGVNAVLPTGRPFGIVPLGTVQCTCRMPDAPLDPASATAALLTADVLPQQVGWVNDCCFLVSASVGLLPELLEERLPSARARRGLGVWPALSGLWRSPQRFELELRRGDERELVQTLALLVENEPHPLRRAIGEDEEDAKRQSLAARVVRPLAGPKLCWLALRGALRDLAHEQNVRSFGFRRLSVRPRFRSWGPIKVLIDGQVRWLRPPLVFTVSQHPLMLMTPAHGMSAAAA